MYDETVQRRWTVLHRSTVRPSVSRWSCRRASHLTHRSYVSPCPPKAASCPLQRALSSSKRWMPTCKSLSNRPSGKSRVRKTRQKDIDLSIEISGGMDRDLLPRERDQCNAARMVDMGDDVEESAHLVAQCTDPSRRGDRKDAT